MNKILRSTHFVRLVYGATLLLLVHLVGTIGYMVIVPGGFPSTPLGELVPKSGDYLLLATHELGKWVFNPSDGHLIKAGTALVLMTTPGGREHMETRLRA